MRGNPVHTSTMYHGLPYLTSGYFEEARTVIPALCPPKVIYPHHLLTDYLTLLYRAYGGPVRIYCTLFALRDNVFISYHWSFCIVRCPLLVLLGKSSVLQRYFVVCLHICLDMPEDSLWLVTTYMTW